MKPEPFTFTQVKELVRDNYQEVFSEAAEGDQEQIDEVDTSCKEIMDANDFNELTGVLDGMGFNGVDAYDFILSCITKKDE